METDALPEVLNCAPACGRRCGWGRDGGTAWCCRGFALDGDDPEAFAAAGAVAEGVLADGRGAEADETGLGGVADAAAAGTAELPPGREAAAGLADGALDQKEECGHGGEA